jgi:hypothetical protein
MLGKDVVGILKIERDKGKLEFKTFFCYPDGKPVTRSGKKEVNFAQDVNIKFCPKSLINYASEMGITVELPEDYERLNGMISDLKVQVKQIYEDKNHGEKYRKRCSKPINKRIKGLSDEMRSIYAESLLKVCGEEWIKRFEVIIKAFIEKDGKPVSEGGTGDGPYLQNRARVNSLAMSSMPRFGKNMLNRLSGFYSARKKNRSSNEL